MYFNSCCFLHEVDHANATPWLGKVYLHIVNCDHGRTCGVDSSIDKQGFCEIHDVCVISECLIKLHHRELWIVPRGDSFVAEYASDFVYALHAANDESLQM